MRYKIFWVLTVAGVLAFMATAGGFAAEPDATVKITGKSIAAGVGYSWGSGVLTYKGKEYPFTVTGISAGDIGSPASNFRATSQTLKAWMISTGITPASTPE